MTKRPAILMASLIALALLVLFTGAACAPPGAEPLRQAAAWTPPDDCITDTQTSGSTYLICMPDEGKWNGDLLVYAHGYMDVTEDIEIPPDQMELPGSGDAVNDLVTTLGYGFATTSYPTNGLAVLPAIVDLVDLVDIFATEVATPNRVLLTGVSEGGLITTLGIERHPDVFDGGLAMCGPYGGFHEQVDHFGDFRIVFDYFFPGLMPGEPITIPTDLMETWSTSYFSDTILPEITDAANILSVTQLLSVTGTSPRGFDIPTDTVPITTTIIEKLLWYNVFATEDAKRKLGGQPYNNADPWITYTGSLDDEALNAGVQRIAADPEAINEIEAFYQTSGYLSRPLVTLHTTGDFVVPYSHAALYQQKVTQAGSDRFYQHFVADVHGHCSFSAPHVLWAFWALEDMLPKPVYLPLLMQSTPSY